MSLPEATNLDLTMDSARWNPSLQLDCVPQSEEQCHSPFSAARGVVEACQQSIHAHPPCLPMFAAQTIVLRIADCSADAGLPPVSSYTPMPMTQGSLLIMETTIFDEGHRMVSAIMQACFRENKSTLLSSQSELKDDGRQETPLHEGQQNWLCKIRFLSHQQV